MRSKKPSAASSPSTLPNPPVFFLDRSIGTKVVAFALRQAGAHVEIHDDHFPPAAPDAEWLREVGSRGWIVLTKDQRIRYRTTELVALTRARVRAFVLTAGDLRGVDMAEIFVRALPVLARWAARHPPPFIAGITRGGAISMILSARQLR